MTDNTAHLPERRDARRNREAVIDAAIALFASQPDASMAEVAAASGVGRTTVYRHFPHRDDLLRAVYRRVVEDAHAVVIARVDASAAAGDRDILGALAAITLELAALGSRYTFLDGRREQTEELDAIVAEVGPEPLASFIAGGQASGQVRGDLTVAWITEVMHHLTVLAATQYVKTPGGPDEVRRMLEATLRGALSAR